MPEQYPPAPDYFDENASLQEVAHSQPVQQLSRLTIPEIESITKLVERAVPETGNVPNLILNALARIKGHEISQQEVREHTNSLLSAMEKARKKALYTTLYTAPATAIWGYQNLLRLAGKDPNDAFPNGTWQFYVNYALREDTARHATETHGFDTVLNQYGLFLSMEDRLTAWVMAVLHTLFQHDKLLENEWRERVYTAVLVKVTQNEPYAANFSDVYRRWELKRPYGRKEDAQANQTYPQYRRTLFDDFLREEMRNLPPAIGQAWVNQVRQAKEQLPAYLKQMSLRNYLQPTPFEEIPQRIPLEETSIAIIHQGHYFLLPLCEADTKRPLHIDAIRASIRGILNHQTAAAPAQLKGLAHIRRGQWPKLNQTLSPEFIENLQKLRRAPILLNFDHRPRRLPLGKLRQAERGVGDHAMTIIDTGETFVFDLSHIFFDGAMGAAMAEILTQEALSWAGFLHRQGAKAGRSHWQMLPLSLTATDWRLIGDASRTTNEATAETTVVRVQRMKKLRNLFKQRSELLSLTINDLLLLFRSIHAATYQPDLNLLHILQTLQQRPGLKTAATAALKAIQEDAKRKPMVLIPVDASRHKPRERVYPVTVEVPLEELQLLTLHKQTKKALFQFQQDASAWLPFQTLRQQYLSALAGYAIYIQKIKQAANKGQTTSVETIKLLAHLPPVVQRFLNDIPNQIEPLNDLIRGREVLSNIGQVAPRSTLTRFITAKDDNELKSLAWGILTDAKGLMSMTLRDFRPHVAQLGEAGYQDLADRIAQDYLDAYAHGLNEFINNLYQIASTQAIQD